MKNVSMLEFRLNAAKILKLINKSGVAVRLVYRGKPIADIVPIDDTKSKKISSDDPFYRLTDFAVEGPSLTNRDIDETIYG